MAAALGAGEFFVAAEGELSCAGSGATTTIKDLTGVAAATSLRRTSSTSRRFDLPSSNTLIASQTKRGAYLPKAQSPGAGEYDPAMAQEKIAGGDMDQHEAHDVFSFGVLLWEVCTLKRT